METENRISMEAPWERVFKAALEVERWPEFLAHYRRVEAGPWRRGEREVRMAASRDGFPCRWTAQQRPQRAKKRILYRHTHSTFTQGMEVCWSFRPQGPRRTEVRLSHAMPAGGPGLGWFRQRVVGGLFVHPIAERTLLGVKRLVEGKP